jgi:hypothetical protein
MFVKCLKKVPAGGWMSNLKLYYHITVQPYWQEFTSEKIDRMKSVGLWDAFSDIVFCVHDNVDQLRQEYQTDVRVRFIDHPEAVRPYNEQYTNRTIKQQTDADTSEYYILRLHNKGINHFNTPTWPANEIITEEIDQCTIDCWRTIVEKLDQGYEAVGPNWVKQPWPHFKGNVWWATSNYVKRLTILKPPHELGFQQQITGGGWTIHDAESWIGTAGPKAWDTLRHTDQIGDHPDL